MEEKDFQRIEQMIGKAVKAEIAGFTEEIKKDFRLQAGILSEDFQHKLQLVGEGHQMLSEKMDRMQGEIHEINNKVTGVAADFSAHRADTESHKRGYMIKEP